MFFSLQLNKGLVKHVLGFCLITFLCVLPLQLFAEEQRVAIGVVDLRMLLQKAPQSEEATRQLKTRYKPQEKQLENSKQEIDALEDQLRQQRDTLLREQIINSEREIRNRKRIQNRALEDYREDLRLARADALGEVQKQVNDAIEQVRAEKNIDVIIQDYLAASEKVDITGDVLSYLKRQLEDSKSAKKE